MLQKTMFSFYKSWYISKPLAFCFQGGIKKRNWPEMSYVLRSQNVVTLYLSMLNRVWKWRVFFIVMTAVLTHLTLLPAGAYYVNCNFWKLDFGISIKINSVIGISNLSLWRGNVNFTNRNLGFQEKIDDVLVCTNIIYHGLL